MSPIWTGQRGQQDIHDEPPLLSQELQRRKMKKARETPIHRDFKFGAEDPKEFSEEIVQGGIIIRKPFRQNSGKVAKQPPISILQFHPNPNGREVQRPR